MLRTLSDNDEISLIAKALKLKGQLVFDLDNKRAFVTCSGHECDSSFVKNKRSNTSTACNKCSGKRENDMRYAKRKEKYKKLRVRADSRVPFHSLDAKEQPIRLAIIKLQRKNRMQQLKGKISKTKAKV